MKVGRILAFGSLLFLSAELFAQSNQVYRAGELQVIVVPMSKKLGQEDQESRIEFRGNRNALHCALDFSSADNEHGFGVVKAEWTPDKKFFVFSLTSSGGHQSWHSPTYFFSRETGVIHLLDDYQDGAGIASANFKLIAPSTIETEIQKENPVPIRLKLSILGEHIGPRDNRFQFSCTQGRLFRYQK